MLEAERLNPTTSGQKNEEFTASDGVRALLLTLLRTLGFDDDFQAFIKGPDSSPWLSPGPMLDRKSVV